MARRGATSGASALGAARGVPARRAAGLHTSFHVRAGGLLRPGGEARVRLRERAHAEHTKTRRPEARAGAMLSAGTSLVAHSLALRRDGRVECWGSNRFQQAPPQRRAGACPGHKQVSAGSCFSLALRQDGSVECFGYNVFNCCAPPRDIPFEQVSCGLHHVLALSERDKSVFCWGDNRYGQAPPEPRPGPYRSVAAGGYFSLGLRLDGSLDCWGVNDHGQAPPQGLPGPYTFVAAGTHHALALRPDGSIHCFGANGNGQAPPEGKAVWEGPFSSCAGGFAHSLGLRSDGSIAAWGWNSLGQAPPDGVVADAKFVAIACGFEHSLGLRSDGRIDCFGSNGFGQAPPGGMAGPFALPPIAEIDRESQLQELAERLATVKRKYGV